jgi:hypothetical protein
MAILLEDSVLIGWVVGFVDGEGCFSVSFNQRQKLNTKIEVRPSFSISQKAISKDCIACFEQYFEGGAIRYSKNDGTWKYETRKLTHIVDKVIPFFQQYPLRTNKKNDFNLFCEICSSIKQNQHLNSIGLEEIIRKAYKMNSAGKRKYTLEEILEIFRRNVI